MCGPITKQRRKERKISDIKKQNAFQHKEGPQYNSGIFCNRIHFFVKIYIYLSNFGISNTVRNSFKSTLYASSLICPTIPPVRSI